MKKFLLLVLLFVMCGSFVAAQNDIIVTRFLEIPVGGPRAEVAKMLRIRGFRAVRDYFTGTFNGEKVDVYVQYNSIRNVWRIVVADQNPRDEVGIKIRFNNLIQQFLNNKKYIHINGEVISEDEDIRNGILNEKKRYQAVFGQLNSADTLAVRKKISEKYSAEQLANLSAEQIADESLRILYDIVEQRKVWFMIDGKYGDYRILMYYENGYNNPSNGEDL